LRLLGKHSQHGLIDDAFADAACLDLRDEWGSIRVDAGQFNVHTGTEGEHGRLPARSAMRCNFSRKAMPK